MHNGFESLLKISGFFEVLFQAALNIRFLLFKNFGKFLSIMAILF